MKKRITFKGEYEEGYKAFGLGYGFDPKTKSKDFMEGYNDARKRAKDMWDYKRNTSLFS